jgi:hypothetical protein
MFVALVAKLAAARTEPASGPDDEGQSREWRYPANKGP